MGSTADAGAQCIRAENVSNGTQTREQSFCSSSCQTEHKLPPGVAAVSRKTSSALSTETMPTNLARSDAALRLKVAAAAREENLKQLYEEHRYRMALLRATLEHQRRRNRMEMEGLRERERLEVEFHQQRKQHLERLRQQLGGDPKTLERGILDFEDLQKRQKLELQIVKLTQEIKIEEMEMLECKLE